MRGENNCTLLMLSNLAEPDWLNINCYEKILPYIICYEQKPQQGKFCLEETSVFEMRVCALHTLRANGNCFLFE